jgi:hypothetical protein
MRFSCQCKRLLCRRLRGLTSSRVQSGSLAKHPGIDFTKWAPVRSKAMLQMFADFLVASKKDQNGTHIQLAQENGVLTGNRKFAQPE